MSKQALLQSVISADQDFEWYPTTNEMLRVVANSINARAWDVPHRYREVLTGVLDIGAGDGRALRYFKDHCESLTKFMAIEKSAVLAQKWPEYVFPVGCDFMTQSLIDKPVHTIFCNPPYSEYAQWVARIVADGFFQACYFVIPQRWKDCREILDAVEIRGLQTDVLWSGNFLNAERAARAVVDIVRVSFPSGQCRDKDPDPFVEWFDTQFTFTESETFQDTPGDTLHDKALVTGRNLIEALETLYHDELSRLHASYKAVTALEVQTLKDIGVEKEAVRSALREKIKGLKNKYWKEVFDNLDKVTSRLTSKSRKAMLEKLMSAVNVDFDASNVYTVLIWVIKNANQYFDQQLVDVFKALSCKKSAIPYKSNRHFLDGSWRSLRGWDIHQGECGSYALDYRFIIDGNFYGDSYSWNANRNRGELLQDIATIAKNLGFSGVDDATMRDDKWTPGEWREATFDKGTLFMAKVYMNGNLHLKFHREFMGRLNVEAGRLLGWLTSQAQAEQEIGDNAAQGAYGSSFALDMSSVKALAYGEQKE